MLLYISVLSSHKFFVVLTSYTGRFLQKVTQISPCKRPACYSLLVAMRSLSWPRQYAEAASGAILPHSLTKLKHRMLLARVILECVSLLCALVCYERLVL